MCVCVWPIATSTWQQCGFTVVQDQQTSTPQADQRQTERGAHRNKSCAPPLRRTRADKGGTGIPAEWFFLEHLSYPDFQAHNWQRCTQQHCTGGRGNSRETSLTLVFRYFHSSLCQKILASLSRDPASASATPYAGSCGPTPKIVST